MKRLLKLKLKILARLILKKYKPVIVGITGSIGKTSTKEAIYHVLSAKLPVRMTFKNYNNEIGLPLTIIGAPSAGRSLSRWLSVFCRALAILLWRDKDYPRVLVLEMGVDRPGDMGYLLSIAPANIGVMTGVSYSHLEYFGSLNNIKKEKQVLIERLSSQGLAVLNADNAAALEMAGLSRARTLTYGLKPGANLQAQDLSFNYTKGDYELSGLSFKLNYNGSIVPVQMSEVMSETAVYAALAAAAVATNFRFNLVEIAQRLSDFSLPPGRMNLLPGIKHSFIIDDSYNSSPEAVLAALKVLSEAKLDAGADKYAVLGDMLEIGHYSEEGHRLVGARLAELGGLQLAAVGERARDIVRGAKEAGLDDGQIFYFERAEEAGRFLQNRIKAGDLVLVKGSQGVRLEKAVKELMAEPDRASELLVRQGPEWEGR